MDALWESRLGFLLFEKQLTSDPREFLTVNEEIKAGLNPAPNNWEYSIFITNSHPSETISVRYQLQGRINNIHTVEVGPSEKKFITGYNTDRPRSVSIVEGKFVER